jgi:transposase-like protein
VELSDFTFSYEDPMTDDRMALLEALQKADDGNFLRSLAETVLQILMEADVEGLIGAGRYERSGERSTGTVGNLVRGS